MTSDCGMKKVFGISFMGSGISGALLKLRKGPEPKADRMTVPQIKQHMLQLVQDVDSAESGRLLYKINMASRASELWMLRTDIYQVVSRLHSQSEAAGRINQLIPCFRGWVEDKQLAHI